jgi:tetratricopeptide (TPR) repeat protein
LSDSVRLDPQWVYAGALYNFSRGLAYVNLGNLDSALASLALLREKLQDTILSERIIPFNTPLQCARIAEGILAGVIAFTENKYDRSVNSFETAIRIEDSLIYTEPKDWPIPARQFLGAYLLRMNKPEMAEKVYREDIFLNPGNGWSYLGLSQSLKAQHKTKDLAAYDSAYRRCFSHADSFPTASVFISK